jgi:hypothetical protein
MSSYLTTSVAGTTYKTITSFNTDISNYATVANLNTTNTNISNIVSGATTLSNITTSGTISMSRKISGFQRKIWNSNDLGLVGINNPGFYSLYRIATLPSSGNDSLVTVKGFMGGNTSTNKINFDFAIGSNPVALTGFCYFDNTGFSTSNNKIDFLLYQSTSSPFEYTLYLNVIGVNPLNFEFVVGGNSSSLTLYEPNKSLLSLAYSLNPVFVYSSIFTQLINVSNTTNQYYFYGNITANGNLNFGTNINGISATKFNYISGLTSDAQAQINALSTQATQTANSLATFTGSSNTSNPTFSTSVTVGTNCFIKATSNNSLTDFTYSGDWTAGNAVGYYPLSACNTWNGIIQGDVFYCNKHYITNTLILKNTGNANSISWVGADGDIRELARIYAISTGSTALNIVSNALLTNGINLTANGSTNPINLNASILNISANSINFTGTAPNITSTYPLNIAGYVSNTVLSSTLTSYQPVITTSTNVSCNNITVGGYAVLPCIIRQNQLAFSIPNNSTTLVTFSVLVNSIGNMGLSYSNGNFTNTSGVTISVNVSTRVGFTAGGIGYRNVFISHSNSAYGRVGEMVITNQTTTQPCVLNVSANLILANNEYFQVYAYQTSGGALTLSNSAGSYTCITIR